MDIWLAILIGLAGLLVGAVGIGVILHKRQLSAAFEKSQIESKKVLEEARREADTMIKEAMREGKEESRKRRQQFEDEAKNRRGELGKLESKVKQREQALEKKLETMEKRERDLETQVKSHQEDEQKYIRLTVECDQTLERARRTLQQIANMSPEEAKRELIKSMEAEAKKEAQEIIRRIEAETKVESERRAQAVVSLAVQRVSSEYVNDSTISVVSLPAEEIKGRIIGREGRNIRAIEQATGIDLIIDDTPEAVIISCFNPIRREIAKISLERLIADGRIHPARIEETVKRVEEEFESIIQENGEKAAFDSGITDLHPDLVRYLGRLRYRTAGQQSVLQHAVETAHICGIMASEMGLNVKLAKRAGLLHDIGKAVDQEAEGHHATIGAELCAKFNEAAEVIEAVRSHHTEDLSYASPYAVVVHTANVLSSSRPGARREVLDSYVQRLNKMEDLVKSFGGIQSAYVMQAGREIRALVTPTGVSDSEVTDLSNDIASKLRHEMAFPGQIKVTVVRESKFVDFAK